MNEPLQAATKTNDNLIQIFFNILGGLITVGIIELGRKIFSLLRRHNFKMVFGEDVLNGSSFHLTYAQLGLRTVTDNHGTVVSHPYIKPGEETAGTAFSIHRPVSSCEVRAAKYLAEVIGAEAKQSPMLSSDYDLRGRLDISFVSFGGPLSNYKTRDVINNGSNQLVVFDNRNFLSKVSSRIILRIILSPEIGFDYGLILKIHPTQFPKRSWFICAGIAEWGTSGAAFYLAHKWKEIYNYSKGTPFAMIVRVRENQDESAEPVVSIKTSEEAETYANRIQIGS